MHTPCSPGSLNPCAAPLLLWLLSTSHELLSPHPNWPWFSSPPPTIATLLMKHLPCSTAFQLPGGVQASRLDSLLSTLSFLYFILGSLASLGINPACEHTSLWEHLRDGLRHSATKAAIPKSTDRCLGSVGVRTDHLPIRTLLLSPRKRRVSSGHRRSGTQGRVRPQLETVKK